MPQFLFYNPKNKEALKQAKQYKSIYNQSVEVYDASKLKELKNTTIAVFGGDGTFHLCINNAQLSNIFIFVPCGTGNDFARNYPNQKTIAQIQLLSCNGILVLNSIGFLFDAHVAKSANKLPKNLQFCKYVVASMQHLFTFKAQNLIVNGCNKNLLMLSVGNGKYAGGGFALFPNQKPSNANFTLLTLNNMLPLFRIGYAILAKFGWHAKLKAANLSTLTKVEITSNHNQLVQLDGEVYNLTKNVNIHKSSKICMFIVAKNPNGIINSI